MWTRIFSPGGLFDLGRLVTKAREDEDEEVFYWLQWNFINRERERLARSWMALLDNLFAALFKAVRDLRDSAFFSGMAVREIDRSRATWKQRFLEQWETMWPKLAAAEGVQLAAQLGVNAPSTNPWAGQGPEIINQVEARVDQILDTTEREWTKPPVPTYDEETMDRMRDDLVPRKKLIVQMEALAMTALAQQWAAGQLGLENFEKTWITMEDERVRPTHQAQHAMTIPGDSVFPNGLRYPGDTSSGNWAEIINCRCSLIVTPRSDQSAKTPGNGVEALQLQTASTDLLRRIERLLGGGDEEV